MTSEELNEYINGENNMPIIAYVPNNTCRILITVNILDDDGEMHEASTVMNLKMLWMQESWAKSGKVRM